MAGYEHRNGGHSCGANARCNHADGAIPKVVVDYETELVRLLAKLECLKNDFRDAQTTFRPSLAVATVGELVAVMTTSADQLCPPDGSSDYRNALIHLAEFNTAIRVLREQLHGSGVRALLGIGPRGSRSPEAAQARQSLQKKCYSSMCDLVAAYLVVFTSRFSTSHAARPWVEAAAGFLVELREITRVDLPVPTP